MPQPGLRLPKWALPGGDGRPASPIGSAFRATYEQLCMDHGATAEERVAYAHVLGSVPNSETDWTPEHYAIAAHTLKKHGRITFDRAVTKMKKESAA